MKTLVFVPTFRLGGIDVLEASLRRQLDKDFDVLVCDTLYHDRFVVWTELEENTEIYVDACPGPPKQEGFKRNLAASYNMAAEYAMRHEYELFISLQDYIWVPATGIQRFKEIYSSHNNALVTGITHISSDPEPSASWPSLPAENFYYSIFDQPYTNKPKQIDWRDVRINGIYEYKPEYNLMGVHPEHWEANWASVPVSAFKAGVFWDELYDQGIAYENMDFAMLAASYGFKVIMDTRNQAISLPHKKYFAGEEQEILDFSNREMYEEIWGKHE